MMTVIVLHELLPTAHHYDPTDSVTTNSLLVGMAVMAISLMLFLF
jgi:ZIP family zinc transporter